MSNFASFYDEIPAAVETNEKLQARILELVADKPIHGKAVQGDGRVKALRELLVEFFEGGLTFDELYRAIAQELPRRESPHARDNRTFSSDWNERLGRTHVNRFYNQAVLENLQEHDENACFVPHSPTEDRDSSCTQKFAGREVEVDLLLGRLDRIYDEADYSAGTTIPGHPNCTHTVVPLDER